MWKSKKQQVEIYKSILDKEPRNMSYQYAYSLAFARLHQTNPKLEKKIVYRKKSNAFALTSKKNKIAKGRQIYNKICAYCDCSFQTWDDGQKNCDKHKCKKGR